MFDILFYDWIITENKKFSIQLSYFKWWNFFSVQFMCPIKQSHAGPYFDLTILGLTLIVNYYDRRHWDYDLNRWEVFDE